MGDDGQIRTEGASRFLTQRSAALAFAILSLGFVWQASRYPYLDDTGPGPGFFAMWIGGLGVLVGLGMLAWPQAPATEPDEPAPPGAGRAILVTLATLVAAAVALEPLGFRLTAFLLLTALLRAYGARWRSALAFAFAAAMLVFLLFDALRLRLPIGAIGI